MKKKIIICVFSVLILVTAITFILGAMDSYNYEAANDDALVGLGSAIILVIGGFVVFYELDLFYTVYYFLIKPKTIIKSILNVISNLILLIIFFVDSIAHFLYNYVSEIFGEEMFVLVALLCMYIISRITCAMVSDGESAEAK